MTEEELLEINKKIRQIEGIINKRKQKVSEWNLDYRKVIEEKPDKTFYLQRKCGKKIIFKSLGPEQYQKTKVELQKKASQSRLKVKKFYNELKDLDHLQKEKNRLRIQLLQKKNQEKQNNFQIKNNQTRRATIDGQKNFNCQNISKGFSRTIKERSNPFLNIERDKLIDFSQLTKQNDQNLGLKLMKHFGVGLENTPLGISIKKEQKKQDIHRRGQKKKQLINIEPKNSFGKTFVENFDKKQKIFGICAEPRNIFEDRLKKIIKYHGDFWKQQFDIV